MFLCWEFPFPSLFCTFPEFSFNRGGARAVHARRSLRRLCPPRHFSSQRGGVSVSEGMRHGHVQVKAWAKQFKNFKTDLFFFSIHSLISCGPISRASTDPVRVHESTQMSGLLELQGCVDSGNGEELEAEDCKCIKGPCPCQTFSHDQNPSPSRVRLAPKNGYDGSGHGSRGSPGHGSPERFPWAGWDDSRFADTPPGMRRGWTPPKPTLPASDISAVSPGRLSAGALNGTAAAAGALGAPSAASVGDGYKVAPPAPLPAPRRSQRGPNYYTLSEVQQHVTADDCWLIAHGRVYDVTSFIECHPGGARAILRHAGTDSSLDFDFHSSSARKLWRPLQVGFFDDESPGGCAIA